MWVTSALIRLLRVVLPSSSRASVELILLMVTLVSSSIGLHLLLLFRFVVPTRVSAKSPPARVSQILNSITYETSLIIYFLYFWYIYSLSSLGCTQTSWHSACFDDAGCTDVSDAWFSSSQHYTPSCVAYYSK